IVAAAAVYALENHIDRLQLDHDNAKQLSFGLAAIDGITAWPEQTESNLVFMELENELGTAVQFAAALKERGVLVGPMGGQRVRLVTHIDIDSSDIPKVIDAVKDCVREGFAERALTGSGPYSK
ncbi:MAG: beta-eliminating lyase-related protein, partial [Fuerstiella sp.]